GVRHLRAGWPRAECRDRAAAVPAHSDERAGRAGRRAHCRLARGAERRRGLRLVRASPFRRRTWRTRRPRAGARTRTRGGGCMSTAVDSFDGDPGTARGSAAEAFVPLHAVESLGPVPAAGEKKGALGGNMVSPELDELEAGELSIEF